MNFKEPISTFAYNLMSLHHDIMWYMMMMMSLVYWSLYKIVKDYSWSFYNKQDGILLIGYSKFLMKLQVMMLFMWFNMFNFFLTVFINIFFDISKMMDKNMMTKNKNFMPFYIYFLGKNYYKGLYNNFYYKKLNMSFFENMMMERYLGSFLFNKSSNALYFYDGFDNILNMLKFSHSINLEYMFGMFPTMMMTLIMMPSMYLLYSNETDLNPALTMKVMGHQWYWSYESASINKMKDSNKIVFVKYNYDSVMMNNNDLMKGGKSLLETDYSLVLPYNLLISFVITSVDVLHSWSVPELGIKVDAVPGRLNQVLTVPSNVGIYYGQCSELCGVSHGFMPIKMNVMSQSDYYNWMNKSNHNI